MPATINTTNLAQNDLTTYVLVLDKKKNTTIGVYSKAGNAAGCTFRLDASWDGGVEYIQSISLSDPTAAVGGAFVGTVATGKVGLTQDRVFGATHVRIVRTDANGGNSIVTTSQTTN